MDSTTIAVDTDAKLEVDGIIVITTLDHRWWIRLWYWIARKGAPVTLAIEVISNVTSGTLTVKSGFNQ